MENNWRNKTIEALEKQPYGDPITAPTGLVRRCLEYVKVPVGDLEIEQIRTLVSQQIGLVYLIPMALEFLDKDILAEGDLYPGDLLESVIKIDAAFWKANGILYNQLRAVLKSGRQRLEQQGLKVILPKP